MTVRNDPNYTPTTTPASTSSPMGGAALAGVVALIVNLIVAWVLAMIFPAIDMGWALTMVAITSFFAGLFGYFGGARQHATY